MSCHPPIEFLVHPPSPPPSEPEPCVLPPVSDILPNAPYNSSSPSLRLPDLQSLIPQLHDIMPVEPRPRLMLTIPFDQASHSTCSSPTSPFQNFSFDTPFTSPASSPTPNSNIKDDLGRPFLLPPPNISPYHQPHQQSRRMSDSSFHSAHSVNSAHSAHSAYSAYSARSGHSAHSAQSSNSAYFSAASSVHSAFRPVSRSGSVSSVLSRSPSVVSESSTTSSSNNSTTATLDIPTPAKRKRGRPPNAARSAQSAQSFVFVTPTVWEVKRNDAQPNRQCQQDGGAIESTPGYWSQPSNYNNDTDERGINGEEQRKSTTSLNTFTSTKMDTTLTMPKKKRGRKPKMQLQGNSCFVWRDLTARRGANKKQRQKKNVPPVLLAAMPSPEQDEQDDEIDDTDMDLTLNHVKRLCIEETDE
ncbi:hypothetical protein J3Q64DRAFT_1716609 [Phycomyces blakesleeanus]|uniref:Uncharacterized protein n=2 Tax=Phycomyces blakesleeanus TaxID=4837 RepID=A0A162V4Q7_PHYB8|nr:hypothetical protein PHYBLDRAFT_58975 [Phycomyces blakesleeanus NRRL 1555(-)]OAD79932.1 hypothetical protein PHYBLDRAFT_58975 [Phycomyces blakesleeanus NRRL 1555(-)]|eukprot:XP_018297972.1 hypothetical protein PHYBLDRAFT_58975 [Phycomyces blakesleeanus NRRL 1555(-)]